MNDINCENILMARMAELDGETPDLPRAQLNLHLTTCENCRLEIEQMLAGDSLLKRLTRLEQDADLWPAVEKRIGGATTSPIGWQPFALLGAMLLVYKLFELIPERDPGMAFKLVPLVIVGVLFILIKENPFRINTELILER